MNLGWLLFSFRGRMNRAKYWLAAVIYAVAVVLFSAIGFATGQIVLNEGVLTQSTSFNVMSALLDLILFVSGLAVLTKRLHDRAMSAWWILVFVGVPVVLAIVMAVALVFGSSLSLMISAVAMGAIYIWAFVEFGCLRGTVGPNAYGPDPLAKA